MNPAGDPVVVAEPPLHEETRKSYNRLSKWYDLFTFFERKFLHASIKMLDVKKGERVLEVGFGTGHGIRALAVGVGENGHVTGLDISEKMKAVAQKRADRNHLAGRVNLIVGDAVKMPFEEQSFDAILMSFVLELFNEQEIPLVLAECKRVLKASGRIGIVSMSKDHGTKGMMRLYEWSHRTFPKVVDCKPIFLSREVEEAGFRILTAKAPPFYGLGLEQIVAKPEST